MKNRGRNEKQPSKTGKGLRALSYQSQLNGVSTMRLPYSPHRTKRVSKVERQKATRRIERIVEAIEREAFPAKVKEFYVFGSYARGALHPGDLDLIVVHAAAPELLEQFKAEMVNKHGENIMHWPRGGWPERKLDPLMRTVMRKPGEKMDILLGTSMERINEMGDSIAKTHRVLIWSETDRDWRAKINSIQPDPRAGRHERAHFADLRLFRGDVRTMLNVTEAISQRFLRLTRLDADATAPKLNPLYQHWYDWWVECKVMGQQSMKLLKHGIWWMQQQHGQREQRPFPPRATGGMVSEDGKYAVYFGQPPLYATYEVCYGNRKRERVCLIPHFKKWQPHEMFVFEKGERTDEKALERIINTTH